MPFLIPVLVGTAATTGGAAATAGLIGTAGAVTAAGVIGTVGAAAGITAGIRAGQAVEASGDFQGQLAAREAQRLEREAEERRVSGRAAVDIEKDRLKRNIESLRARRAASGVQEAGTPLLVELEAVEVGTLDVINIGRNIEIGAQQAESAADIARIRGTAARREGRVRAGTSLFRAVSSAGTFAANRLLSA